jgi:hypothetical protein
MIQYLLFDTSKLLNISDITKRIGNFFKLPIQLFYGGPYPELALYGTASATPPVIPPPTCSTASTRLPTRKSPQVPSLPRKATT